MRWHRSPLPDEASAKLVIKIKAQVLNLSEYWLLQHKAQQRRMQQTRMHICCN